MTDTAATGTAPLTRNLDGAELPRTGTYAIDTAHTTIAFVVRHMMVSKVRGHFNEYSGKIAVADEPKDSRVEVTIQTASVDTREPQRDAHLRSPDFFDVEKFPTMTFTSTEVTRAGDDWKLAGDLTIHGVTRPVTLALEFLGATRDPYGGTRIGFSATTEINREDFGLTYNAALEAGGVVVSKNVKIEIEAEAVLEA